MAGISITDDKKNNQTTTTIKYPTTSTGAQGNTQTGTNIVGGVVPNRVLANQKPATEPVNEDPVTPTTGGNTGNTGAGTKTGTGTVTATFGSSGNTIRKSTAAAEPQEVITAEQRAQTSLNDLKNDYSAALREQYNYSTDRLREERDAALRENWILQQQEEAALPERVAASGLNGGASETSLAALKARFQGNRNNIQSDYMSNLGALEQQQSADQAELQRDYNERWLEYLLSLAKKEAGV